MFSFKTTTDTIYYVRQNKPDYAAPCQTAKYIARIMNTKIETCPTVDERPTYHGERERTTAHDETEIDSKRECVGGVGRKETVVATTIAVYSIDEQAYRGVVGGSPSCHERLYYGVVHGTSQ